MKVKKEKNEKKSYKNAKLRERGVTLIALIVTIIIMLILAAIGIRAISGDNGAISKAKETKEMQRATEIKEYIRLTANDNKIAKYSKNKIKSKNQVIQELYDQGKLKEEEVEELKTTSVINIKGIEVDFSKLGPTLGSVYTDEMIGQKITYSANGVNDWAILGRDDNGNILIVPTKLEAEPRTIIEEGEDRIGAWLNYEERLHSLCSIYGTEVQNVKVKARSITFEDFFRTLDLEKENYIVNYNLKDGSALSQKLIKLHFPCKDEGGNYAMVSFEQSGLERLKKISYYMSINTEKNEYLILGSYNNETIVVTKPISKIFKILRGYDRFAVANSGVSITDGEGSTISCNYVVYELGPSSPSIIMSFVWTSCDSEGNVSYITNPNLNSITANIKPVVELPPQLDVVENENGKYDLLY